MKQKKHINPPHWSTLTFQNGKVEYHLLRARSCSEADKHLALKIQEMDNYSPSERGCLSQTG